MEDFWYEPSEEEEALYGTSPPYTPRQMKRMSGKHQKNSQARSAGRSPVEHSPNKSKLGDKMEAVVTEYEVEGTGVSCDKHVRQTP